MNTHWLRPDNDYHAKISPAPAFLLWTNSLTRQPYTRVFGRKQPIARKTLPAGESESARSQSKALKLDLTDYEKSDLHIHVPAGATPKDGPSAGATIVVALASLLVRRLVRSDVAMTGEISLRGRILRVGGIKEKVIAAARSGLKQVILPELNRNDWLEVPAEIRQKLKAHFVRHISDLIPLALRGK